MHINLNTFKCEYIYLYKASVSISDDRDRVKDYSINEDVQKSVYEISYYVYIHINAYILILMYSYP
jgi:hypothetical protein